MMTAEAMQRADINDAELVAESLDGNRDGFRLIVERYQTLISSLAYCATGNVSRSEDLAQETFVSAWKQLAELREPAKLRPWLCSIARFLISKEFRRQGREPDHAAESLEAADECVSPEPLPPDQVISDEEKAILWRSLERVPEIYREPLVLFYREQQSVEAVAQDLGLSEEAVKQRLSRGRKLLQEQFLAFVAGALKQTSPGKAFTLGVIAALPLLATTAKAATVGTALASHGSVAAKTTSLGGFLQASSKILLSFAYWLAPILPVGGYIGYKMGGDRQHSERARRSVATFWRVIGSSMLLFVFLPVLFLALVEHTFHGSPATFYAVGRFWMDFLIPVFIYGVARLSFVIWVWQRRRRIGPETAGGAQISSQAGKSTAIWVVLAMRTWVGNGVEVAACRDSMTKQRREGEANGPRGQRPARASRAGLNWAELVRLAHQAVVALVGAETINRAEPRACGHSRGPRRPDPEPGSERAARAASNGAGNGLGRAWPAWAGASNRIGENPLYGMMRGGGGNVSTTWRPFATPLERADAMEAAGLNWARLRSTRPVVSRLAAELMAARGRVTAPAVGRS